MNRRGFLSSLIGVGVAAVVDPERLLWVPGAKLISIPKPRVPVDMETIRAYMAEYAWKTFRKEYAEAHREFVHNALAYGNGFMRIDKEGNIRVGTVSFDPNAFVLVSD